MLVSRWLATLPLFALYSTSHHFAGCVALNLGDEAWSYGLGFCGRWSNNFLIPDPDFLRTLGYEHLRAAFQNNAIRFEEKIPKAFWRGSVTGYRVNTDAMNLPRVSLCRVANERANIPFMDVGLVGLSAILSEEDCLSLRAMGYERDYVPPTHFDRWRLHIDIDGSTNSWSGLFQKLLSGGLVLKISSYGNWKQWFYDRLEPFTNFVPVEKDFSDLLKKTKFYIYSESEAKKLSIAGRELATVITYRSELLKALDVVEQAIIQHQVWHV
jgi:hypothetical protein